MTKTLRIATSPDTILNLVRQLPLPAPDKVKVLGVDDFSFRRGRNFGTMGRVRAECLNLPLFDNSGNSGRRS